MDARHAGIAVVPPHKYHALATWYGGHRYHSKREAQHAAHLDLLIRAGVVESWERQVRIPIRWPDGRLICTYVADFWVVFVDGHVEIQEVKGVSTPVWRLKHKLLTIARPDIASMIVMIR